MELTMPEQDVLGTSLARFDSLTGDHRTRAVSRETVRGIIGGSACVAAASRPFPPGLAASAHSERRVRRMLHAETKRTTLDADALIARLQAHGVEQLRGETAEYSHRALAVLHPQGLTSTVRGDVAARGRQA